MTLEQLPTEILHGIGEFLTAEETATLRLVSRNVSAKVSQGPFASVLRSKTRLVEFSPRSLQLLVEMTRPGAPGTALESLVLVGVPSRRKGANTSTTTTTTTAGGLLYEAEKDNDDDDDDDDRASITALLAEAMRNLNANSEHRGLLSLGLTVDGRAVGKLTSGWVDIWMAASGMFHLTLDALRRSGGLNLAALDLFTRPYCCSLSVANFWRDDLDELLRQCSPSIGNIRRLHVSISRERGRALTIESESESGSSSTVPEEPWPPRDEGFARFLAAFRSVDDLKIHRYIILPHGMGKSPEAGWFRQTRARGALGNLTRCSLQGIIVGGGDLLGFVRASPGLRAVEMDGVTVKRNSSGGGASFREVFDWLTTRAGSRLRDLRLEDLQEDRTRIVFAHEPDDEVDDADGWGRFRLRRRGEASVRRPVRYAPVEGLQVDWAFRLWVARDKLKYGIPSNCTIEGTDKTAMDYY